MGATACGPSLADHGAFDFKSTCVILRPSDTQDYRALVKFHMYYLLM